MLVVSLDGRGRKLQSVHCEQLTSDTIAGDLIESGYAVEMVEPRWSTRREPVCPRLRQGAIERTVRESNLCELRERPKEHKGHKSFQECLRAAPDSARRLRCPLRRPTEHR